jgi:hypothetical protein
MFIFSSSEPAITIGTYILNSVLIFDLSGADAVKYYDCVTCLANLFLVYFCTAIHTVSNVIHSF